MTEKDFLSEYTQIELVRLVLTGMDIPIVKEKDNCVYTAQGFEIEIEGKDLYRLSQDDSVIAPFNDVVEMCLFIKNTM